MKMTLDERETNLFFNEADKTVQIVSYDKRLNKRLRNLAQLRPQECKPIPYYFDDENGAESYSFPSTWLRINPPKVSTMTVEQREKKAELMRAMNKQKKESESK